MNLKNKRELEFEQEVINYLTNIGSVSQWEYLPKVKTTKQLWDNFKNIIEANNQNRLSRPLSTQEFNQIKKRIDNLKNPYEAGQFLYGTNGVSEIDITMDDGKVNHLVVFDQSDIGSGKTVYQVVNQIQRKAVINGAPKRIFDVTLLINGLPIIQIELKKAMHSANEALNQMERYISERQYTDIFSTLQILIAMTPHEIRYMANTTAELFNKAFAFEWQQEDDSRPINNWKTFCDLVLSIPMAHEISTRYMILDGTQGKESIKVMRPYQVYATKKVLDQIRRHDFNFDDGRLGYIWHTTGSGKTITSFKTAWLASKIPKVDKVVFLVDRVALTNQTSDAYKAYDQTSGSGIVEDTTTTRELYKKLRRVTNQNIIVTSIQKMANLVNKNYFKGLDQNIVFIVDEAHRSTGAMNDNGMLKRIKSSFPTSAWVGYTGTPNFETTKQVFGDILHSYTIREAIADRNVLGFKVEFKETIVPPEDDEGFNDNVITSIYDTSEEHVKLVVEDILNGWYSRSSSGKYNALFSVAVGGITSSVPRVMEYYDEFHRQMSLLPRERHLKIGVTFSVSNNNSDGQLINNISMKRIMDDYNKMFNTNFDMTTTREYSEDLVSRLNRTNIDRNYLDLVIVIDQLLTGFDAPELNTLYLDRTIKDRSLIQAYSRTNRIHNRNDKPYGNVVNYRWPDKNELEMNEALTIYSNRDSAVKGSLEDMKGANTSNGLLASDYGAVLEEFKTLVKEIKNVTNSFSQVPDSEIEQKDLFKKLNSYGSYISKLKQYPYDEDSGKGFPGHDLSKFYSSAGITETEELILRTNISNELTERLAESGGIDIRLISLDLELVTEVRINYDYLSELIAQLANEVNKGDSKSADTTKGKISDELNKLENPKEKNRFSEFVEKVYNGFHKFSKYPVTGDTETINKNMEASERLDNLKDVNEFIQHWGIANAVTPNQLIELISKHKYGKRDLDRKSHLSEIIKKTGNDYKMLASDEVKGLVKIKYITQLKDAIYELADKVKENE